MSFVVRDGCVAQSVEQWPFKPTVEGSIPPAPTKRKSPPLGDFCFGAGGSQLLGFRGDEKGGVIFRECAKPRAGVAEIWLQRWTDYL